MISTIANGGTVVTPHVVKALDEGSGWIQAPVPHVSSPIPRTSSPPCTTASGSR
jgi:cell division protein FtsI/penicillin-binding protein 2